MSSPLHCPLTSLVSLTDTSRDPLPSAEAVLQGKQVYDDDEEERGYGGGPPEDEEPPTLTKRILK
jgi:hypothetical protein